MSKSVQKPFDATLGNQIVCLLKLFPLIRYSIEQDPAGWFRVNKTTGEIFVIEALDRESSHVTNGTYTVTVLVTEKGNTIWLFCIWQKLHPSIFQTAYPM